MLGGLSNDICRSMAKNDSLQKGPFVLHTPEADMKYDCEPYLRALEAQAEVIQNGAAELLRALDMVKSQADSTIRSSENMKKMVEVTRRAT